MKIEKEKLNAIYRLLDEGHSGRKIAQELGVSYNTVLKYIREKRTVQEPEPQPQVEPQPAWFVKPSPEILEELRKANTLHFVNFGMLSLILAMLSAIVLGGIYG